MKSRKVAPLPVIIGALVAALAITLSSVGSASAGSLTRGAVKKIAAKVVSKQAPSLTVARAATATKADTATTAVNATTAANATNLSGKPASSYQDTASVYTATIAAPTDDASFVIPLAAGTYQVSYSAFLVGAGGGDSGCYIGVTTGANTAFYADEEGYTDSESPAHSGSAVITVGATTVVTLFCDADNTFTTDTVNNEPIQVTAIPLDSVTNATLTLAP